MVRGTVAVADVELACVSDGAVRYSLARRQASGTSTDCGRKAAMADESVQPVPCVFFVGTRGAVKGTETTLLKSRSLADSPSRWPPLR